jgi:putative holliday junction resolvase
VKLIAIDPGSVRVGIAVSAGNLALARPALSARSAAQEISQLVSLEAPDALVIGFPLTLSGRSGSSASRAIELGRQIRTLVDLPIWLLDERLTTAAAASKLRASGKTSREQRAIIDSQAACELLEFALDLASRGANLGQNLDEL